jgi:hypothetical protein
MTYDLDHTEGIAGQEKSIEENGSGDDSKAEPIAILRKAFEERIP